MITAIDQDKGRPRGIGYTILSGKSWGHMVGSPMGPKELVLQEVFVYPVSGKSYLAKFLLDCTAIRARLLWHLPFLKQQTLFLANLTISYSKTLQS